MGREMKNGDIYFWRWKEPRETMPYHCCACKAEFANGLLMDTFWYPGSDSQYRWTAEEAEERLFLEYRGNENEMRPITEQEIDYYNSCDVVDMRHSNNSRAPIYVHKDAKRNQGRMLDYLEGKREREESKIRISQSTLERIAEAEKNVLAGDLDSYLP